MSLTDDICKQHAFKNRIRHTCDSCDVWGMSDPAYGIHSDTGPVILDPVTGFYRLFSTCDTVAFAVANFAGWTKGFVEAGKSCPVRVIQKAQVELVLASAVEISPGDLFAPITETAQSETFVSDYQVAVEAIAANAIYRVVKECACPTCSDEPCPPAMSAPADVSPTSAPTRGSFSVVLAEFNVEYVSGS